MSFFSDLRARAGALLFRKREEREMEEELRFHLAMEREQQLSAGLDEREADRQSRLALGGVERTKEDIRDARGTRWLDDALGDVRYALRTLARTPAFTLVAVLTLAVGIGGTTAVFSAVDAVLIQPLPYQQPGQLVRLYQTWNDDPASRNFVSPVAFLDFRSRLSSFEAVAALGIYQPVGADVGTGNTARRIRLLPVSASYFEVLRSPPGLGRAFLPEEENGTRSVVLSHRLWEDEFGGAPSAIGKSFSMSGQPYTVVGVTDAGFDDPVVGGVDAWVPLDLTPGRDVSNIDNHYLGVVGRLRSGVSLGQAQAELNRLTLLMGRQYPAVVHEGAHLYSLKDDIVGGSVRALELMLGAAGLVLLLVCVNLANLLLVRGTERAHEFALRTSLGARRSRLIRQLLVESLVLALLGGVSGVVVARLGMSAIVAVGAGSIPRLSTLHLDPRLLLFSLAVSTLSAVLVGLAPALRAGRAQPRDALAEQGRSSSGSRRQLRGRRWLVAAQVALAFVLLVGAGLLTASVQRLRALDLGVRPDRVLVFELGLPDVRYDSSARARFYTAFEAEVERLPDVSFAGGISKLPATGPYHQWGTRVLTGPLANTRQGEFQTENRVVSGHYFQAAGIPLISGRLFDAHDDARATPAVIISRSAAARLFPGTSALGQQLSAGGMAGTVVGVVGDVAIDPEGHPDLYVYHAHAQVAGDRNWALTQVVRTRVPPATLEAPVRGILSRLDPQLVMDRPMTLARAIGEGEVQRTFTLRLLGTFAFVALGVAALGLFGVLSYGVRMRRREFGIRLALGAERRSISGLVLREGLAVTGLGIVAGVLGALGLSRVMASILFRVSPLDPSVLLAAGAFTLLVAFVSAYIPARRATRMDPMHVLREE